MGWLSILPPILAISLAIWKKDVILALLLAIVSAELLLHGLNPVHIFIATVDRIAGVFTSSGNTMILLFSLLIGALLNLIRQSGGVSAFVHYLQSVGLATSSRRVGLMTSLLGVFIFIESNLSVLASGIFAQKLFDRFHMSRARLAYIIDSTCSPVSVLILMNGWGAMVLGLLDGYELENPVRTMVYSIPLNFYALSALALVFYTVWSSRVHFSLARFEQQTDKDSAQETAAAATKMRYFLVPMLLLTGGIIGFMLYTGEGDLFAGSGSASVLYATILATLVCFLMLRLGKIHSYKSLLQQSYDGMGELLPLVSVLLLAIALGQSMQALGTGDFIAGIVSENLPLWLIPGLIFLAAAATSFCTGTSWGTFGILVPVAIPIALDTGLPPSLLLAAVLGGGVFGDHASPISDSTIISSLASGCDHLTHVKTQLPYALIAGGCTLLFTTLAALSVS